MARGALARALQPQRDAEQLAPNLPASRFNCSLAPGHRLLTLVPARFSVSWQLFSSPPPRFNHSGLSLRRWSQINKTPCDPGAGCQQVEPQNLHPGGVSWWPTHCSSEGGRAGLTLHPRGAGGLNLPWSQSRGDTGSPQPQNRVEY